MHEKLFENQRALNPEDLIKYAESLGLNGKNFMQCLDSGTHADGIREDVAEGKRAGVTGTPSSLLGWVEPDGKTVKAVKIVKGAKPYQKFKEEIDELLSVKKK